MTLHRRIQDNLARVRARIADAASRSGRRAEDITLVAATKYVGEAETRAVIEAGCLDLGESRPQDLWDKATRMVSTGVRWHLIGHLQRNKIRRTLPLAALIHSVDSERLLTALDQEAGQLGLRAAVLLEVNISADATKHGFSPEQMGAAIEASAACRNLEVRGLMGMASFDGGPDVARRDFARLRELRDQLAFDLPAGISLADLSMGMSGDFIEAIEEGATLVRVGSALFEGLA